MTANLLEAVSSMRHAACRCGTACRVRRCCPAVRAVHAVRAVWSGGTPCVRDGITPRSRPASSSSRGTLRYTSESRADSHATCIWQHQVAYAHLRASAVKAALPDLPTAVAVLLGPHRRTSRHSPRHRGRQQPEREGQGTHACNCKCKCK